MIRYGCSWNVGIRLSAVHGMYKLCPNIRLKYVCKKFCGHPIDEYEYPKDIHVGPNRYPSDIQWTFDKRKYSTDNIAVIKDQIRIKLKFFKPLFFIAYSCSLYLENFLEYYNWVIFSKILFELGLESYSYSFCGTRYLNPNDKINIKHNSILKSNSLVIVAFYFNLDKVRCSHQLQDCNVYNFA